MAGRSKKKVVQFSSKTSRGTVADLSLQAKQLQFSFQTVDKSDRKKAVRTLYDEIQQAGSCVLENAIGIGGILLLEKKDIEHGDFIPFLQKEYPYLKPRTYRLYMQLAENEKQLRAEFQNGNALPFLPISIRQAREFIESGSKPQGEKEINKPPTAAENRDSKLKATIGKLFSFALPREAKSLEKRYQSGKLKSPDDFQKLKGYYTDSTRSKREAAEALKAQLKQLQADIKKEEATVKKLEENTLPM